MVERSRDRAAARGLDFARPATRCCRHDDPRGVVARDAAPRADARGVGRRTDRGHRGARSGSTGSSRPWPATTWSTRRRTTTTSSLRVHDPAYVEHLRTIHAEWSRGPYDDLVGQDRVVPYVFPTPAMTQGMPPTRGRGDARPGRAVRLRHDDPGRARHLGGGPRRRRLRPDRRRPRHRSSPVERSRDPRRTPSADRPATTSPARGTAAPATSTTPPSPRRRCSTPATPGSRSSTSTPTTATARRRSSGTASDVLYASTHVDPGAGWFPHYFGHARETGAGTGTGATLNLPAARGHARRRLARRGRAPGRVRRRRDALVVSLGVDAAADDPESPLLVTADGYDAAGRLLGSLGCRRWSSRRAATTCPASVASSRPTSTDTTLADGSAATAGEGC